MEIALSIFENCEFLFKRGIFASEIFEMKCYVKSKDIRRFLF